MEKRLAHYNLNDVKALASQRGLDAFTSTAINNARLMGLDGKTALSVILGLERNMLFKSMTTHTSNQVWQDVYHAPCPNGLTAYIKVTIQAGTTVIQFKEK